MSMFSNVKVKVIGRAQLIWEITHAAREYKKNTKWGEKEKNRNLKFKNERDFLHYCTFVFCLYFASSFVMY